VDGTEEICFSTATELAGRMRRGDVSAREVVETHLRRIEAVNPRLNAIVTLVAERALAEADLADTARARRRPIGPLHGLPIAVKDAHQTAGIRTTQGSPIHADDVPERDELIVERERRAGAIVIGKTNLPEFGAGSQTFNPVFGATPNPYDLSRTSGGSSGGSAVALASGMSPLADGSDMGGSLRNPAAFCNVVGLRPSPGRVPSWPSQLGWSTLSVDGPLGRTVADVALLLSAIAGPDARSPIALAEPGSRFAEPLERDFRGTRIAWVGLGLPYEPEIRSVVDAQRPVFEGLGCAVEADEPDFSGADEVFKGLRAWSFVAARGDDYRDRRELLKRTIVWNVEQGLGLTAVELARLETLRTQLYERLRLFMERYEYLVLPVTQILPFDVTTEYPTEVAGVAMGTYIDWMKSCYYISAVGNPAISVPGGFSTTGLPVGIQIVGRHNDDWSVLQLAHAFEGATGHWRRRPGSAS
jgi:amidase